MRKITQLSVAAISAAAVGFLVHKSFADRLPAWVSAHMGSVQIKLPPYGPEVVVPAALTSLEPGLAFLAAYLLARRATPAWPTWRRALVVAALCLGLQGSLLRMPVMQLVVGNPVGVTLVQHAALWMPYVAACLVVAYAYEFLGRLLANSSRDEDSRDAAVRRR